MQLLAEVAEAKVLAGGQTLGPMLNLRLAQPPLLVDITRIAELAEVAKTAMASGSAPSSPMPPSRTAASRIRRTDFWAKIAAGIGYRAVRTRGTIGGSLAHADPAADWLTFLTALGAELMLARPGGRRRAALGELCARGDGDGAGGR